ncbi:hypothetical protein TNCV_2969321 [Trichonephila clavipes]|nr:hypothetical protein TNCV_2969321 [Trichonephila clavipes]
MVQEKETVLIYNKVSYAVCTSTVHQQLDIKNAFASLRITHSVSIPFQSLDGSLQQLGLASEARSPTAENDKYFYCYNTSDM